MLEMIIQGWEFNFESLPNWDNRERIAYITDDFFENKTSDTACMIYSIAEVGMCNYIGFLAILRNKKEPVLFLNITNFNFPKQEVCFSSDGHLIFVQSHLYNKSIKQTECPLIIIDIQRKCFSYFQTDNCNPCYQVKELNHCVFSIMADEFQKKHDKRFKKFSNKKIKINRLKWFPIEDLANFPVKYFDCK